ncbi:MAG: beta-lactamase family protein [Flavobacteriales bacterium]|jgi:CubicO group peptidase (beta-lactamase class C family)|nr:beta-lactamase family protein [Flavobacteriales bacterium]
MKKIVVGAFALVLVSISYSQKLELKIDQIFKEWNQEGHPGGVLMIKKKGELLCSKAYGKANVKYQVPNANETVFNIGSTSKQFTAMGVVKLYLENKLSFDDDIRKYLPELQEFEQIITIRHLLHHTSGFRSTPELFALAGWRDGDAITTEDDYHYLCKQNSLNFSPGEQFMYANSNYVLLAKLVEHITQEPFQLWMKTNVFEPLNMKHTFIDETNTNANSKVATPYNQMGQNQFLLAENISLNIGASNTYTTAEDLTIWMSNFQQPAKGWEKAFELLQTTDTLNNGELNKYAFGVLVDEFFGNKRIQHSGGIPGFLSYAEYYPEEEMTIVLLTNFIAYTVQQKQMELLKLLLKNKSPKREKPIALKPLPLDVENAKKVVGDYWNTKKNYPRKIYYENDTLWYLRDNGIKSQLVQTNDNEFVIGGIKAQVIVQFEYGEQKKMIVQDGNRGIEVFEAYDNRPLTEKEKRGYLGRFYSQELETFYEIKIQNGHLIGDHSRHGSFPVNILKRDLIDWSGMAIARYARDNNGTITGFFIDMNRVENVWFQKVVCE